MARKRRRAVSPVPPPDGLLEWDQRAAEVSAAEVSAVSDPPEGLSAEAVLVRDMGFEPSVAREALRQSQGALEAAVALLIGADDGHAAGADDGHAAGANDGHAAGADSSHAAGATAANLREEQDREYEAMLAADRAAAASADPPQPRASLPRRPRPPQRPESPPEPSPAERRELLAQAALARAAGGLPREP